MSIFAWQVFDTDGEWGAISAFVPWIAPAPIPLMTRSEKVARELLAQYAHIHARTTGHPVRLARYELAEVVWSD